MSAIFRILLLAAAGSTGLVARADSQAVGGESGVALDAALERAGRVEEENTRLREANATLARSLAAANAEGKTVRDELRALRADLEALGVTVFDTTGQGQRARLIAAVAEAGRERDARAKVEQQLLQLSEAVLLFLDRQPGVEAKLRADLEAELRGADRALAAARAIGQPERAESVSLTSASVLSLKPELGLVVLNVGTRSGVRLGMPFQLRRQDRVLGQAIVVDTREDICGAIPLDGRLLVDQLQVGDTAKPGVD